MGSLSSVATIGSQSTDSAHDHNQYLTFLLNGELFAIGILNVKEILEYENLTSVPMMPQLMRGVINLRGAAVPVIDLSVRFAHKPSEITRRSCVVIIEVACDGARNDIGIIVDAVSEVLEIPFTDIEPPPALGANIRADFITGMGKVNNKFVMILDVAQVLSIDEMTSLNNLEELG